MFRCYSYDTNDFRSIFADQQQLWRVVSCHCVWFAVLRKLWFVYESNLHCNCAKQCYCLTKGKLCQIFAIFETDKKKERQKERKKTWVDVWSHLLLLCEYKIPTYRLFAPWAADGNNLFAVKWKLLLKSLLVRKAETQLARRFCIFWAKRLTGGGSPSHTADTSLSDVSCGPSGVAPHWTEIQQSLFTMFVRILNSCLTFQTDVSVSHWICSDHFYNTAESTHNSNDNSNQNETDLSNGSRSWFPEGRLTPEINLNTETVREKKHLRVKLLIQRKSRLYLLQLLQTHGVDWYLTSSTFFPRHRLLLQEITTDLFHRDTNELLSNSVFLRDCIKWWGGRPVEKGEGYVFFVLFVEGKGVDISWIATLFSPVTLKTSTHCNLRKHL